MSDATAQLHINNQRVRVSVTRLTESLLSVLREDLRLTGTKEGCGSGDCGACTVVAHTPGIGTYTLNSCITPAGALLDSAVLTVEGVAVEEKLHTVQQAMVDEHAAQCGFCTPGFVMSMVGDQLTREVSPTHQDATIAVSGNLCRCTGYRPILAALEAAWVEHKPEQFAWLDADEPVIEAGTEAGIEPIENYLQPRSLEALRTCLADLDESALIIAGTTDVWLRVSQQYQDYQTIVDVSRVEEMSGITHEGGKLRIGAGTTHAALQEFFSSDLPCPAILRVLERFGSPQIRARGTIGGNLANASSIADWPPLLLTMDTTVHTMSVAGTRAIALTEFYLGYHTTQLQPGEIVTHITCQAPVADDLFAAKVSKRAEDDISSVLLAVRLTANAGVIEDVAIAAGGIAATPVRLPAVETQIQGLDLSTADTAALEQLCASVDGVVQPLSDVRASAEYRLQMVKNLLMQALLEKQGDVREDLHHV